jgi:hypothetical protein
MLRECEFCPESAVVLENFFNEFLAQYDADEKIKCSQWTNTDRSQLLSMELSIANFKSLIIEKLEGLHLMVSDYF